MRVFPGVLCSSKIQCISSVTPTTEASTLANVLFLSTKLTSKDHLTKEHTGESILFSHGAGERSGGVNR